MKPCGGHTAMQNGHGVLTTKDKKGGSLNSRHRQASGYTGIFDNNILFENGTGVVFSYGTIWENNLVYGGQTLYTVKT